MVPPRPRLQPSFRLALSLVLAVLLGGAPLDGWLHGHAAGTPLDGSGQVHDGDCHHLGDAPHDPSCQVCTTARTLAAPEPARATPGRTRVDGALALLPRLLPPRPALSGVLGARGPPVTG